jgi:hypothetical protein
MIRSRQHRGYVLVMVLAILTLAASVLAAAACRTSDACLEAGDAQRSLQRKWAFISSQAAVLDRAEELLADKKDAFDRPVDEPPAAIKHFTLDLGGSKVELILADEQAKANVNMIAKRREAPEDVEETLRRLQGTNRHFLSVRLRPSPPPKSKATTVPVQYESFDQCLVSTGPEELVGADSSDGYATGTISCWGGGKVNFRRAPLTVLREVTSGCLDENDLDVLIRAREQNPEISLTKALALLKSEIAATEEGQPSAPQPKAPEKSDKKRDEAMTLLTDSSHCHSLWIIVREKTRNWYRLYVNQFGDPDCDAGRFTLAWQP